MAMRIERATPRGQIAEREPPDELPGDGSAIELPGTDALAPYDRIREWDGLPSDRDATVAVYCMSGNMSRQAALALVEAGYTDVRELDGGMLAWEHAGRDLISRGASEPPDG